MSVKVGSGWGSRRDIPDTPYYVLCNDAFMSGWGEAQGLTNTLILPCADYKEAEFVANYAKSRSEMRRVRIVINKPRIRSGVLYSVMSPEDATAWYNLYITVTRRAWPLNGGTGYYYYYHANGVQMGGSDKFCDVLYRVLRYADTAGTRHLRVSWGDSPETWAE